MSRMYNNVLQYQKAYFSLLFDGGEFDNGFYTIHCDKQYINGNSIVIDSASEDLFPKLYLLLNAIPTIIKLQFPVDIIEMYDERDELFLIEYQHQRRKRRDDVDIELVTEKNYKQYINLSSNLQVQEFGELYKSQFDSQYLNQDNYQMYMIKSSAGYIGEFIYMPNLKSVESIIVAKDYQRQGIMSTVLELLTANGQGIYLSADNCSIGFYKKVGATIIDSLQVNNIYGTSHNLIMYLSLIEG